MRQVIGRAVTTKMSLNDVLFVPYISFLFISSYFLILTNILLYICKFKSTEYQKAQIAGKETGRGLRCDTSWAPGFY